MPNEALEQDGQEGTPSDVGQGDATGRSDGLAALGASLAPRATTTKSLSSWTPQGATSSQRTSQPF